jgi:2-dehydro-3-deoxy-D-arabinonate dehydratase
MRLVRFYVPGQGARIGQWVADTVYDLTASGLPQAASLTALLRASVGTEIEALLADVDLSTLPAYAYGDLARAPTPGELHLLPPIDRQEAWAAGVTYAWSREARVREAVSKEIYVKVYEAERPELFFKATPDKAVGPGDWVGIRGDSHWNVPEPELTLVINPEMQIVGYTVGNDMSSRDIEGENPLYLPQAKVYRHSCALGPAIRVAGAGLDASDLSIRMVILRGRETVFEGETTTANIHRDMAELAAFLGRYNDFPYGALLLTGTGIVPGDDFTLQDGDEVSITIQGIGTLTNPVKEMKSQVL